MRTQEGKIDVRIRNVEAATYHEARMVALVRGMAIGELVTEALQQFLADWNKPIQPQTHSQ